MYKLLSDRENRFGDKFTKGEPVSILLEDKDKVYVLAINSKNRLGVWVDKADLK